MVPGRRLNVLIFSVKQVFVHQSLRPILHLERGSAKWLVGVTAFFETPIVTSSD